MVWRHAIIGSLALAAICVVSCGTQTLTQIPQGDNTADGTSGAGVDAGDDSVFDVFNGGGEGGTTLPLPFDAVRARVRNESSFDADITMRFMGADDVVHLAFVRVVPATITTVTSPRMAERVELSGLDGKGDILAGKVFRFGIDFVEGVPAEYVVRDPAINEPPPQPPSPGNDGTPPVVNPGPPAPDDTADSGDDLNPEVPIDPNTPPIGPSPNHPRAALLMLEPAIDFEVRSGTSMGLRWDDFVLTGGTKLSFFLREVGGSKSVPLANDIDAQLDGFGDEIEVLVEGAEPGVYEVVGMLHEVPVIESVAPGRVLLVADESNEAPTIALQSGQATRSVRNGEFLHVEWKDSDPDDNALIRFSLESAENPGTGPRSIDLLPTFEEDPDGAGDEGELAIEGVIPGQYNLVASISDGELSGSDRLNAIVRVLPDRENDAPTLTITHPVEDFDAQADEEFTVKWIDTDENDNATISLLLDPDLGNVALDGDEYLLASSIAEDDDGDGDEAQALLPTDVPNGAYRLVGVISDGLTEVTTSAAGLVYVGRESDQDTGDEEPIEDVGSVPVGTVTTLDPLTHVVEDSGDPLTIRIISQGSLPSRHRIYLSNVAYGGSTRVEVFPSDGAVKLTKDLYVPLGLQSLPNRAWPRSFDIETDMFYSNGSAATYRSLRPVWIRQQVEIVAATMLNYACGGGSSGGEPLFRGLEITWYGGGYSEVDVSDEVQLWLSKDDVVPVAEEGDPKHRLLVQGPASPNMEITQRFSIGVITGLMDAAAGSSGIAEPGLYELFSVYEPFGEARTVSRPYPQTFRLCGVGSASGSALSP